MDKWTELEIAQLVEAWLAGEAEQITSWERNVFSVKHGEKEYVLKRKDPNALDAAEYRLLAYLEERGVPVPVPLKTRRGTPYAEIKGQRFCLYRALPGKAISSPTAVGGETKGWLLGKSLAELHVALQQYPGFSSWPVMDLEALVMSEALPALEKSDKRDGKAQLVRARNALAPRFPELLALPTQLIHRDPHPGNMLFEGDRFTGFLDFELSTRGIRIFDLAYCATAVLSGAFAERDARDRWLAFLPHLVKGYGEIAHLSEMEKRQLWAVMVCIEIIFQGYFLNTGADAAKEMNHRMMVWLLDCENLVVEALGTV